MQQCDVKMQSNQKQAPPLHCFTECGRKRILKMRWDDYE